jgi:hypothetical protein
MIQIPNGLKKSQSNQQMPINEINDSSYTITEIQPVTFNALTSSALNIHVQNTPGEDISAFKPRRRARSPTRNIHEWSPNPYSPSPDRPLPELAYPIHPSVTIEPLVYSVMNPIPEVLEANDNNSSRIEI